MAEGVEFEGPTKTPQVAGKGGAYIVNDSAGMRMVQADVFQDTYAVIKKPAPLRVPLPNQYT